MSAKFPGGGGGAGPFLARSLLHYNDFNVYWRELAPGTVCLTGDRATTVNNGLTVVKSSNRPRVFLPIFSKAVCTTSISFALPNRPAYQ